MAIKFSHMGKLLFYLKIGFFLLFFQIKRCLLVKMNTGKQCFAFGRLGMKEPAWFSLLRQPEKRSQTARQKWF